MSSDENNGQDQPQSEPKPTSSESGVDAAGYIDYLKQVVLSPDEYFDDKDRGQRLFGLITLAALLVLLFLKTVVQRAVMFSASDFQFGYITHALTVTLALAIVLAGAIFAFQWYAGKQSQNRSLDFIIEKFGATAVVPALLMLISIPLNMLGINMHGWFRAMSLIFVYIGVFMTCYWYVAPNRLKVAAIFTLAFYFAYRLLLLVF